MLLPTPCAAYTVADLRRHVLAWLQFFAAALSDPDGSATRIDPQTWDLSPDQAPDAIVRTTSADIAAAARASVADRLVTMSQARMAGDGSVLVVLDEAELRPLDPALRSFRSINRPEDLKGKQLAFTSPTSSIPM